MPRKANPNAKTKAKPITSVDGRSTVFTDPTALPVFGDVIEAIATEEPPTTTALMPIVREMPELPSIDILDSDDEVVMAVRELISFVPMIEAEFVRQAHRIQSMAIQLRRQQRKLDMLLAELALNARALNLWAYLHMEGCTTEAQFWEMVNGTTMETVNRWINLRMQVVPLLKQVDQPDEVIEKLSAPKAKALIQLAKQATAESRPLDELREHVETIIAASEPDLRALQQMSKGLPEKVGIVLTLQPRITPTGQRGYRIAPGWITEDEAKAWSAHNSYLILSVNGESIHPSRLADLLREYEPVIDTVDLDLEEEEEEDTRGISSPTASAAFDVDTFLDDLMAS